MNPSPELDRIRLVARGQLGSVILSTGASVVDYSGQLYNVSGSSDDPHSIPGHNGSSWKELLVHMADLHGANCYVTNAGAPSRSTHAQFSVGGHMTVNRDGSVPIGGDSYLMPLCSWHNHTSRNEVAFDHTETRMLKLAGYMQGEPALMFKARLASPMKYSLLYFDPRLGEWNQNNLSEQDVSEGGAEIAEGFRLDDSASNYLLLERGGDGDTELRIREVKLPE